jgi:hypothetical protein
VKKRILLLQRAPETRAQLLQAHRLEVRPLRRRERGRRRSTRAGCWDPSPVAVARARRRRERARSTSSAA